MLYSCRRSDILEYKISKKMWRIKKEVEEEEYERRKTSKRWCS